MSYPKQWEATPKQIKDGWKNNPKVLSELTSLLNDEEYIENESEFMETMDNILEIIKSKYNISEKKSKPPYNHEQ